MARSYFTSKSKDKKENSCNNLFIVSIKAVKPKIPVDILYNSNITFFF